MRDLWRSRGLARLVGGRVVGADARTRLTGRIG